MEQRVEDTGDSFDNICNALEQAGPTTGGTRLECCVNALNNKMRCNQKAFLDLSAVMTSLNIDTSTNGVCDRRASGTPAVTNACSDNPP